MLKRDLGVLIVQTSGTGIYSKVKKAVPFRIIVEVDPDWIQRQSGKVVEAPGFTFQAFFAERHWDTSKDGHMYTDDTVTKQINQWLAAMGYEGGVGWSERGRQAADMGDFDADYKLIDQFFPQLVPEMA